MTRVALPCLLATLAVVLTAIPLPSAEVRWGRGTAEGMFIGDYTDLANWNADNVAPDPPRVPGSSDRARVDRGGTEMTLSTTIAANEFLFGVDEPGQTYVFTPDADVSTATNYFVSFNRGTIDVDIQSGAMVSVGGNFLLGQYDGNGNGANFMDDEDITVTLAGTVNNGGVTIIGDRYGFDNLGVANPDTTSIDVNVLLDITTGTLRTSNLVFAPNGDLDTYLDPDNNNTLGVQISDEGLMVIAEADATGGMNDLITAGLLFTNSVDGVLEPFFDGTDTLVRVVDPNAVLVGDMNGDNEVNFGDLSPFALGLTDVPAYDLAFPDLVDTRVQRGDVNEDDAFNFGDLTPFADLLSNGGNGSAAVPEPTSLALVTCGLFGLIMRRRFVSTRSA